MQDRHRHFLEIVCVCSCILRVGEGRACWSLGNAYVSLENHKQALHYARKHLDISKEVRHFCERSNCKNKILFLVNLTSLVSVCLSCCPPPLYLSQIGDRNGELTARLNVEQLMEVLGVNDSDLSPSSSEFEMQGDTNILSTWFNFHPQLQDGDLLIKLRLLSTLIPNNEVDCYYRFPSHDPPTYRLWAFQTEKDVRWNCAAFICTFISLAFVWCLLSTTLLRAETHTHVLHFPLWCRAGEQTLIQTVFLVVCLNIMGPIQIRAAATENKEHLTGWN